MFELVTIALGGAVGSILRYALSSCINSKNSTKFPVGTFVVNVFGCFLIGLFSAISKRYGLSKEVHHALITGLCGGFTTFSTFSNEILLLLENRHVWILLLYAFGSVVLGVAFVEFGKFLVTAINKPL